MNGWEFVVVGDKKTPHDAYKGLNCTYLTPDDQERLDKDLSDLIGWNCIQRRNMGFLYAWRKGAEIVATIDDDNIPMEGWGREILLGKTEANVYDCPDEVFDPVSVTNHGELWHRGFPIELVEGRMQSLPAWDCALCDIQANFWNGDADIDAICRKMHPRDCRFADSCFPIASTTISPFNSQNTILGRHVLPDYFVLPHVARCDDIWASYIAQAHGHRVVYGKATVVQDRHEHDVINDMQGELLMYRHTHGLVKALKNDPEAWRGFVPERTAQAFDRYRELMK